MEDHVQCLNCKKYGHFAFDCRYRAINHVEEDVNFVERANEDVKLLSC